MCTYLSVHPELTPSGVMEALKKTANKKDSPNNVYGWGLINAYDAALYNGMIMSNKPEINAVGDNTSFSVYAVSKNNINPESVKMHYSINGGEYNELLMGLVEKTGDNNSGKYAVSVPFDPYSENVNFYFTASDDELSKTIPFNAPTKFFYINKDKHKIEIY
jgi:hypothetical protein